ncbi:MAG: DUF6261 family protein, partial [Bacteroidales bacterium]|nr:DUF6261 family protein [Bacteroidales bacterium]
MKFTRIDLARLRNEEWFQFMTETKDIIKSDNKTYGDVSEFMVKFEELLSQADAILQQLRKSDYTAQMQQTDYERDEVYRSLKYQVLSFAHHYEQAKREAGEKLEYVFETYGNIPAMSYSQQTASIYNLIQDLQTKFSNEVSLLALLPWVDKLHEKNEAFEKETMSRNDEYAGKLDVSMSDVRK